MIRIELTLVDGDQHRVAMIHARAYANDQTSPGEKGMATKFIDAFRTVAEEMAKDPALQHCVVVERISP